MSSADMSVTASPRLRDRDWLYSRYVVAGMTQQAIGDSIGCAQTSVSGALRRMNIPVRARAAARRPSAKPPTDKARRGRPGGREPELRSSPDPRPVRELRERLADLRSHGKDFDAAWAIGLGDVTKSWEPALNATRGEWERAYNGIGPRLQLTGDLLAPMFE
jgi:hypothetical protein